ncbi:MAG: hypothetical protein D3926_19490 [Desulfobacteraceae bacterium]|nr:MAG: hypothetical protein D3926_19490 [Desulfobacteraceae bacterium]
MNLESQHNIVNADLEWIKGQLAPEASYIVFEHNLQGRKDSIFSKSLRVYDYLEQKKYSWQQVKDGSLFREYLVIRIEPGKEEETLGKMISLGFPKSTVYYLYRAGDES